jgi:hypothetical protein
MPKRVPAPVDWPGQRRGAVWRGWIRRPDRRPARLGKVCVVDGEERGDEHHEDNDRVSGRDRDTESDPTESGHSSADTQVERNQEDEPPG